jgi:transposase
MFSSLLDRVKLRGEEDMARVTHAAPHLSMTEVKNRMRTDPCAMKRQRWLIIYNALVEPRRAEAIARHCGVSKATVHAVISRYNRLGVAAIETPGKGGRRRQYLTLEEEQEFLAPFFAQAECGEIATVGQIWRAFEQRVGHPVDNSTVYRLLHRHGWRKVMPRPKHPKSDRETQEQFKKTFPIWWKRQWPQKRREMNALCSFSPRMKGVLAGSIR